MSQQNARLEGTAQPQRWLGRYQVVRQLGRGAMGVVYLARDPIIDRQVALKTLHIPGSIDQEELRDRFLREAHSAGVLHHTNVVTIYDVFVDNSDNSLYLAMEYVDGIDLQAWRRQTEPTVEEVLELMGQVTEGLGYAHSKGILHRDVKPANVLRTADGVAKIADFGVARVETSDLTVEGQLLGTPNYMSPEGLRGQPIDHRSDLFSAGVMLFQLLTGRLPFQGNSLVETARQIAEDEVPEVEGMHPEVRRVVERSLAKDPDKRYQSGSEMAADLRDVAVALQVEAGPTERVSDQGFSPLLRWQRLPATGRWLFLSVVALSLLIVTRVVLRSDDPAAELPVAETLTAGVSVPVQMPSPPVVPATSRLEIDFFSEYPSGTVAILAGEEEIFRRDFRFTRERRVFKRKLPLLKRKTSGSLGAERTLTAGVHSFSVQVWPKDEPSRSLKLEARLPADETRRLRVILRRESGLEALIEPVDAGRDAS